MNSKGHFYTSLIKSGIRLAACILAVEFKDFTHLAIGFFIAELLGVFEEILDKR